MKNNDVNKKNNLIIVLLIIIIALLGFIGFKWMNNDNKPSNDVTMANSFAEVDVSDDQSKINDITKIDPKETEYTDFLGYGLLTINEDEPYIYLQNPDSNSVYMQFDVLFENNIIYESELISPGHQEKVNIYDQLDSGEHVLNYSITTYDIETKELCMAGIQQEQKVEIIKEVLHE